MTLAQLLLALALLLNLITFLVFGWDKWRARGSGRRVPESRLLGLAGCGGIVGAWAGMLLFRHKTRKTSFLLKIWFISAVWLLAPLGVWATRTM